jgi:hypothetical protein
LGRIAILTVEDPSVAHSLAVHGTKRKREVEVIEKQDMMRRQRAFMQRSKIGSKPATWKPRHIYRASARKWCVAVDGQFQSSSGRLGLQFFKPQDGHLDWQDPFQQPHFAVAMDLGSDGVAGYYGLERRHALNCDLWNDQDHGTNCDWDLLLGVLQSKSLWVLMLVDWNMPYGPRKGDDYRLFQMGALLRKLYETHHTEVPLYSEFVSDIVACLRRLDQLPGNGAPEDEAWEWMKFRSLFGKTGKRTTMSRFTGTVYANHKNTPYWPIDEFESTYVCMEMGLLGEKQVQSLKLKGQTAEAALNGERSGSTAITVQTVDDAAVRSCCQNAMVIRYTMHSDQGVRRKMQTLDVLGAILMEWRCEGNKQLRSYEKSWQWVKQQVNGGYMAHLKDVWHLLSSPVALAKCGFAVSPSQCDAVKEDLESEEYFADFFGQGVVGLVALRARRNLPLVLGWPKKLVRMHHADDSKADSVVKEFMVDQRDFRTISDMDECTLTCKRILGRSLFHKSVNIQFGLCFDEVDWRREQRTMDVVRNHSQGIIQTTCCEETIGSMKNNSSAMAFRKFRRPVQSYVKGITSNVISERHDFQALDPHVPLPFKCMKLSMDHFQAKATSSSVDFAGIASTQAKADWYSPKPFNMGVPTADLQLTREFMRVRNMDVFDNAKLGMVCEVQHRLLIQDKTAPKKNEWMLACTHFADSSALVWPMIEKLFPGPSKLSYFEPVLYLEQPQMLALWDLDRYNAVPIVWHSWAWQVENAHGHMKDVKAAVRPFMNGTVESLLSVCCRRAFWNLGKASIELLAKSCAIEVKKAWTLFETLFNVIQEQLELEDDDVLSIIALRLSVDDLQDEFAALVLDIEEAYEVLSLEDINKLNLEQENVPKRRNARQAFMHEYREKKQAVRAAKEALAAPAGKGKGKAKGADAALAAPMLAVPPATIDHITAKLFLPPTRCSIWRGLARGEWCGHCTPRKRIAAKWDRYGENGSMMKVLQTLWMQWAEIEGLVFPACCQHEQLHARVE